ncbi:hypothetical protein GMOD_00002181 [Pyrenophora seminiperda CCB06]|uniref:Uncharacterized protein n=1 Tax=Pyrenophora seminiperda CCB06 TaxID=1302712 RepID=A0A3M7LX32_9PLEO|nr:hypothetical protein GMOD_00002181 [Pyrenophora seminiperda CCB06]
MQFSTIVLALAATASAAVLPREEFETPREQPHGPQGYWAVSLSNGPDGTKDAYFLTTTYYNDDVYRFPDGYTNTCVVAPNAERPINHPRGCDKTGYEWSYENRSKS